MQVSETLQRLHADARVIAAVEAQGKKSGTPGLFSTAAPCHFAFCVSRLRSGLLLWAKHQHDPSGVHA